jgi:hypothetical protein
MERARAIGVSRPIELPTIGVDEPMDRAIVLAIQAGTEATPRFELPGFAQ